MDQEAVQLLKEIRDELHETRKDILNLSISSAVLNQRVVSLEQWRLWLTGIVGTVVSGFVYILLSGHIK